MGSGSVEPLGRGFWKILAPVGSGGDVKKSFEGGVEAHGATVAGLPGDLVQREPGFDQEFLGPVHAHFTEEVTGTLADVFAEMLLQGVKRDIGVTADFPHADEFRMIFEDEVDGASGGEMGDGEDVSALARNDFFRGYPGDRGVEGAMGHHAVQHFGEGEANVVDFPGDTGELRLEAFTDKRVVIVGEDAELVGDADALQFAGAIEDVGAMHAAEEEGAGPGEGAKEDAGAEDGGLEVVIA